MPRRLQGLCLLTTAFLAYSPASPASAGLLLSVGLDGNRAIGAILDIDVPGQAGLHERIGVGPLIGQIDGGPTFQGFCVDLFSPVIHPGYDVEAMPISSLNPSFGVGIDRTLLAKLLAVGTTDTRLQGASLQLAVWGAVYNNGANFAGNTLAPWLNDPSHGIQQADLVHQTNAFLDAARMFAGPTPIPTFLAPTGGGQGLVTLTRSGLTPSGLTVTAVPEPSTLVLASIGIVVLCGTLRRRAASARPPTA